MKVNFLFLIKFGVNLFSIVLSFYLLYEDFEMFLSKPTYTSDNEEFIQPENFPGIFLCPLPAYNLSQLNKHGYTSSFTYITGRVDDKSKISWSGNISDEVEKVADEVVMLKSIKDCPGLHIRFHRIQKYTEVKFELAYSGNPPSQCCRAIIPENSKEESVITINVYYLLKKNPNIEGFQIFLSNQESFHKLKMHQFNTNGIILKTFKKDSGYKVFKVRIHDHIHLEEDSKIQCKNYKKKTDYAEVI